jgi:putative NADPH-quinone reductase
MDRKVVAVTGSYRKDGTIDRAVEAILQGAREKGAQTRIINLAEQHVEFCINCRQCTQAPGTKRGKCPQQDDVEAILAEIETADVVVLASPVNHYNATALFRRFLERLLVYVYWPWGQNTPRLRSKLQPRQAVLVASAAMPDFLIPFATGAPRALRLAAASFGAKPIGHLWIGLAAGEPHSPLSARTLDKAHRLGMKLG